MPASVPSQRVRGIALALLVMLVAPGAIAQNYAVNIDSTLHGLDIQIEPVASAAILVLKLTNKTGQKVRCDILYDAAPQPLQRKTTYLDPGRTEQSAFAGRRTWHSVDVNIECFAIEGE